MIANLLGSVLQIVIVAIASIVLYEVFHIRSIALGVWNKFKLLFTK